MHADRARAGDSLAHAALVLALGAVVGGLTSMLAPGCCDCGADVTRVTVATTGTFGPADAGADAKSDAEAGDATDGGEGGDATGEVSSDADATDEVSSDADATDEGDAVDEADATTGDEPVDDTGITDEPVDDTGITDEPVVDAATD